MTDSLASSRVEALSSEGTRINFNAIFAGGLLAIGIYFLLATLGGAVGLTVRSSTHPKSLHIGMIAWAFVITVVALFVGGVFTSLLTSGETKTEAVISGIVMWALLVVVLLVLSAAGIRAGFNAMLEMSAVAQSTATQNWETAAISAGVPADQIAEWHRRQVVAADKPGTDSPDPQALAEVMTRISWYAFAGTWLSMLAAAGGAYIGAGPHFRVLPASGSFTATRLVR